MLTIFASLLAVASAAPGYRRQASYGSNGAPTVELKNGTISGVHSSTYNEDYFLGVPYAQPPVNGLRFKNPQSLNTTYNSTYEATEYANSCVGYGGDQLGYPVSEDCLYLNIVRPSGYENETLPIGLWIHGGGLFMGGSRDARYNLSFIVENSVKIGKPIIGVSINYRLAGWGLLASEQVSGSGDTNIALRDQRLALHWVQENIGAFGGDASKVTIWGESAGAASVGWHLLAYNGRDDGLFRAGIMQSGNPVSYNTYRSVIDYQPRYDALVNATGCGNTLDTLECLRYAPYEKVNAFFNSTGGSGCGASSTTETSRPCAARASAASIPMNPAPRTTARRAPVVTFSRRASASSTVRRVRTLGESTPGIGGTNADAPGDSTSAS